MLLGAVVLDKQETGVLEQIARGCSLPAPSGGAGADCSAGCRRDAGSAKIASELGITPEKAARWRNRYLDGGIDALGKDASRRGRPRTITDARTAEVIRKTTQERPFNATHWSTRNGTATLFAAIDAFDGTVISMCDDRYRHEEWLKFLRVIDQVTPPEKELHLIVDNYATHKHPKVQRWLARHPRFHVHFTPTSSSWLNMVERFFRDLTQNRLRRGVFHDAEELILAIGEFIDKHNQSPKPFIWTAKAFDILEKVKRARRTLDNRHSA